MSDAVESDCTVLVSSFDGFEDCWAHFEYGINKYWADCPWPIVLMTGKKVPKYKRISALPLGQDRSWASNMIEALKHVKSPYVLYMQEDYWLVQPVKTDLIKSYLKQMQEGHWRYMRLTPWPTADQPIPGNNLFGVCLEHNPNRVCLQSAIWDREFLLSLLYDGESGWNFESRGRERTSHIHDGIFSVYEEKDGISYCGGTAVRKGRWTQGAIDYAQNEGLDLDIPSRGTESRLEEFLCSVGRPFPAKVAARVGLRTLQVLSGRRSIFNFLKRD